MADGVLPQQKGMRLGRLWREALVVLLLAVVFGSQYSLDMLWRSQQHQLAAIGLAIGLLTFMSQVRVRPFPRRAAAPVVFWMLFALAVTVASILHGGVRGQIQGLWLLLGIPLLSFNVIPLMLGSRCNLLICWSLLLTATCLVLASLAIVPVRVGVAYSGIFPGPYAMGTTVAMMIIGSLGLLKSVISREKVSNAHVIALSMLILLGFVVAFLTAFRTVIATCMLLLLVFAITNYNRARKLIQISALGLGVLVSLAVALALAGKADQVRFWELAMIKHERRLAGASGVWSHRDSEWGYVISHANWLGHGLDFAERQPVLHSWHSPFTLVLGAYGAPAAFFFVAFWLISLIYAFRYARLTEGRDPCNQLPLLCIIFFLVHSLGAIMFKPWAVGPIFGFLIAIGTVVMREAVQQRHEATAPARSYARNPAESGPCRQV